MIIIFSIKGSELTWDIYFLFLGVTKHFQRIMSNAMNLNTFCKRKSKFSRPTMLVAACFVIPTVLHFIAEDQSSNQGIDRAICCNLCDCCTYFFLCWTHCDALSKVLMCCCDIRSTCIQLKSCASQWCTSCKFGAYCIHFDLARQRHMFVHND